MGKFLSVGLATVLAPAALWPALPAFADPVIDVTPPTVTFTGLQENQFVGAFRYIFPDMSDDTAVTKVQLLINGRLAATRPVSSDERKFGLTLPSSLNSADADITVRAWDAAENHGEATTRVHVDTVFPTATITPAFETYVGGIVTFAVTEASDDVARVTVRDDRTNLIAQATSSPWTMTWDTAGRNGAEWLEYRVADRAGNTTMTRGFLAVDNTAPDIYQLEFPRVSNSIQGRSRIVARIDDRAPIARVEWWVNGELRATNSDYPHEFDWDSANINGTAELEVRAFDIIGNTSSIKRTVTLDNAPPTVTSTSPGDNALVRGNFVARMNADDRSGLGESSLLVRSFKDGANGEFYFDKPPFTQSLWSGPHDGPTRLAWTVSDRLGNTTTVYRTVRVDNTRPTLKFTTAPRNKARVKGKVTVAAYAWDRNGINRVELLINGKVVAAKDAWAPYKLSFKVLKKYGKTFKVQLRAYDKVGNVAYTQPRTWRR